MRNDAEFDKWCNKWEAAMKTDAFKSAQKPQPKDEADFFGNYLTKAKQELVPLNEVDTKYWREVAGVKSGNVFERALTGEPTIERNPLGSKDLKAQRDVPDRDTLGQAAKELGQTANPVEYPTRGADFRSKVTDNWSDGKGIREIANLYRNLYDLQVKLNQSPRFGAFGEDSSDITKIQDQIDDIKYKIDKLSDSLSPDFVSDANS